MSRSSIAVKSSGISLISQVLIIGINFIIRTCFIKYLGVEILGIDGVIKDCISMLSLADLGVSSAMVFRLYRAVIDNDEDKINDLMAIYKQIYGIIAFSILIIGLVLSIFLKQIITDIKLPWNFIYIVYYLQLISTVSTYLLAYKRSILNADQKNYILILIDTCINVVFSVMKIYAIILMHNYVLFLVFTILQNIISNIFVHIYCRKYYHYLTGVRPINKDLRRDLLSDTKNVFAGKIAGYIYGSTDNIVISIFKGTVLVGYLSNYKYIFSTIKGFMNCITAPIQPLIGNYLNSIDDKKQTYKILNYYTHIRYIFSALFVVPAVCLTKLFITLWAGESYILTFDIVVLLAIDFYVGCIYGPLGEYIIGMGLFKYEKYATIVGTITNLLISLIAVRFFGIQGVLVGTVFSQVILWICKSYIIFKFYFKECSSLYFKYWIKQIQYIVVLLIMNLFSISLTTFIYVGNGYISFIVKGCVIEVVVLSIYFIVFKSSDEYRYFKVILHNFFKSKFKIT